MEFTYALTEARPLEGPTDCQLIKPFLDRRPPFSSDAVLHHELQAAEGERRPRLAPVQLLEPSRRGQTPQLLRHLLYLEGELRPERRSLLLELLGEETHLGVAALDVVNGDGVFSNVERYLHVGFLLIESRAPLAASFAV